MVKRGDWIQPLVAAINCTLWVFYGLLQQPKRDWPIVSLTLPVLSSVWQLPSRH